MKKWKCIICGYIHEGEEPPESCPICKAPASKFILLKPGEEDTIHPGKKPGGAAGKKGKTPPPSPSNKDKIKALEMEIKAARRQKVPLFRLVDFILAQMVKHHAHPVSVHFPNGVLPVAVLFFAAALLFNVNTLATAGFLQYHCGIFGPSAGNICWICGVGEKIQQGHDPFFQNQNHRRIHHPVNMFYQSGVVC